MVRVPCLLPLADFFRILPGRRSGEVPALITPAVAAALFRECSGFPFVCRTNADSIFRSFPTAQ